MVEELTAAIVHARDFLRELSRDRSLPESIRLEAKHLLRHYSEAADIWLAGRLEERR
ncbi:BPSL0761 family protein [Stutzerimonas kunmingensis]|uniref:BPSL0761 family protein n=2 Tax=Pseudomonadaceae TaxID=135621 RepID=UPI0025465661